MTKRQLASRVGISEQLMGEIESGWRNATPTNLRRIAQVLNCPVVFLERKRDWGEATAADDDGSAAEPCDKQGEF